MRNQLRAGLCSFALAAFSAAVSAHHSVTANFDTGREIEIRGVVMDFKLRSPHSSMVVDGIAYVDGEPQAEAPQRWEVESSAASGLIARGISADSFQPGDQVVVVGAPHRNPSLRRGNSSDFRKPDAQPSAEPNPAAPAVVRNDAQGVYRLQGRWRPPFQPSGGGSALPLNAAGLAAWEAYDQKSSPANTCEPMNIPVVFNAPGYLVEIGIGEDGAVVRNQAYDVERRIALGVDYEAVDPEGWFGRARARVDGESLVINSRDFRPSDWGLGAATQINGGGADVPNSSRKEITERFSVSGDGLSLVYEYTLFDPQYMREPHDARIELTRVADAAPMIPYDCQVESARMFSRDPGESLLRQGE